MKIILIQMYSFLPFFLQRLGLKNEIEIEEILHLFARGFHSIFTGKTPDLKIVEDDPDDDIFFECAVALKAQFIIWGDKDVLNIEEYMGVKVVSPKQFIQEYTN